MTEFGLIDAPFAQHFFQHIVQLVEFHHLLQATIADSKIELVQQLVVRVELEHVLKAQGSLIRATGQVFFDAFSE